MAPKEQLLEPELLQVVALVKCAVVAAVAVALVECSFAVVVAAAE